MVIAALGLAMAWSALVPGAGALAGGARPADRAGGALPAREIAFLDTLERRTFRWFWDLSDPVTGLTPDRAPTPSFSSISAVGFARSG